MNLELFEEMTPLIADGKLKEAIEKCETRLNSLNKTYFHFILGKNLLRHTKEVVQWIEEFYQQVSHNIQVQALYFEMNGFVVNADEWYIDGFAYQQAGNLQEPDWLGDWDQENATEKAFTLTGFEKLQKAFEDYFEEDDASENLEAAGDIAEILVILRLQELMAQVHQLAKEKGLAWGQIPLLTTAHDYEFIYQSK